MSKFLILFPLFFILMGCGVGDRAAPWRAIHITKNRVCFSMDKTDSLSRFSISSVQNGVYKEFSEDKDVTFSYPDSCRNLSLIPGYTYGVSYTLNNKNYRYVFFIDTDWNVKSTYKE
ncbi:putative T6SS immunity periplasmic lipoprotein [Pantoea sp. C2G6]|uniref:putative T6SS immunity periplasmic lipoprotein n=1 Tax=Pantoea sp. C2G6 TaxID=3243084 RepID=UPI003ED9546E